MCRHMDRKTTAQSDRANLPFVGGVSVSEYLAAERASETKHELWAGEVFAMAGAP